VSHAATPSDFDAAAAHGHAEAVGDLSPANIDPPARAKAISLPLLAVGVIGLALVVFGAVFTGNLKHALAAYHVGVMAALAMCLGSMFWVMAFHLTQAGWSVTLRRQFENIMSLTPIIAVMVLPTLIVEALNGGLLFAWMSREAQHDPLFAEKSSWFNQIFFFIRALLYIGIWSFLSWRLWTFSTEQDRTGDRWLTNRARFTSAWGMLAFALTVAFASFDWLMSLDYRFFSTMWGVYYFAGAAYSSLPVVVLLVAFLRGQGKLRGLATAEHAHDMGKLMFGFTVFWAYIGFSQYFLIWYANIPEETQFMLVRKLGFWRGVSMALVFGHFIIPFYIMLWLFVRRSFRLLSIMAVLAISMEVLDMWWIIRPFVSGPDLGAYYANLGTPLEAAQTDVLRLGGLWLDAAGVIGVLGVFFGLLFRRVGAGPLVPSRDPRLAEAIHHRNYV
jgi:hypothetical protein